MMDIIEATIAQATAYLLNFGWFSPPHPSVDAMIIVCACGSYRSKLLNSFIYG